MLIHDFIEVFGPLTLTMISDLLDSSFHIDIPIVR